jgi:hypothetical protein
LNIQPVLSLAFQRLFNLKVGDKPIAFITLAPLFVSQNSPSISQHT